MIFRFNDIKMTLFQIFKTYGYKTRDESRGKDKEVTLFYDFHPYNSTEPILLALMIKDPDSQKTI